MASPLQHDGKTKIALRGGATLDGHFWPAAGGEPTPAILRWDDEQGGRLDLIEPPWGWRAELGGPPITIHGTTAENEDVTLLDSWVNRVELGDRIARLHVPTVAIGEKTLPQRRWPRAIYSTANLSEWRAETGLKSAFPSTRRARTVVRVDARKPPIERIELPRAEIRLEVRVESRVGYAPSWEVDTWLDVVVEPKRAFTIDAAFHDYADPLLAFTHFASDRPDGLTREVLLDPRRRERIEVLRQGRQVSPREWRPGPGNGYLFQSADVPDLRRALRRWWRLADQTRPALGLFAEHVEAGRVYSPSRFLTLYTALERYAKVRHDGKREFRSLRDYGGVPAEITGASNGALKLIGASRGYFSHGETQGKGFSVAEIEDGTLESIRRASALMQSCLLRELGFRKAQREGLLELHYRSWPIP
jgi:hypothetical protein